MVKADTEFLMYLSPAILHTIFISFILSQSYGLTDLDVSSTLNLGWGGHYYLLLYLYLKMI